LNGLTWKIGVENGNSLNYAVRTNTPGTNKADYMGKLKPDALSNKDTKKMFIDNFPTIPENASNIEYYSWYSASTKYCMAHGIFLPPVETMRTEDPYGSWVKDLPEAYAEQMLEPEPRRHSTGENRPMMWSNHRRQ
jgi:hypothetical protein